MMKGLQDAKYLHHDVQNKFLSIIATALKDEIASEVLISGFFALIVDKTCHITKTKQLSVVLHIFDGVIYEEFIGYHAAFQQFCKVSMSKSMLLNATMVLESCVEEMLSCKQSYVQLSLQQFTSTAISIVWTW